MQRKNPLLSQHHSGGGIGPIVGALIIVVALLIAGSYYWAQHLNLIEQEHELQAAQESTSTTSQNGLRLQADSTLGTSTKISDIEKDLKTVTTTNTQ